MLFELPMDLVKYIFSIKSSLELVDLIATFREDDRVDEYIKYVKTSRKKKDAFTIVIKELMNHILQEHPKRNHIPYCNQSKEYRANFRCHMDLHASEKHLLHAFSKLDVMFEVD